MAVANLNEFPVHNVTLNINRFQFTVLVLGLLKFMLLQILLHRKRISVFFAGFRSHFCSSRDEKDQGISDTKRESERSIRVDKDRSVAGGEVEMVLRRLGMFYHGGEQEEKFPAKLDSGKIFDIFEEREPSLDEVREAFDVFDSNRDGFIDETELQKVLRALGLNEGLEMENCRRMIAAFDEDGDARIDFGEFVKFMEISFI